MITQPSTPFDRFADLLAAENQIGGDIHAHFQQVAKVARDLSTADLCLVFPLEPMTGQPLACAASGNLPFGPSQSSIQPPIDRLLTESDDEGMLVVEDVHATESGENPFPAAAGIRSFVGFLLESTRYHKPLACVFIGYSEVRQFRRQELDDATSCAKQAAQYLQIIWIIHRYLEAARIGQAIAQETTSVEALFVNLANRLGKILNIEHYLVLAVPEGTRKQLRFFSALNGEPDDCNPLTENPYCAPVCDWVFSEQRPVLVPDSATGDDDLFGSTVAGPILDDGSSDGSILAVPVEFGNRCVGVLYLSHPERNIFYREDRDLLTLVGSYIGLTLNSIDLHENLQQLNEAGEFLTRRLDSTELLQNIVDEIGALTAADVTVLYAYEEKDALFELPPRIQGVLRDKQHLERFYTSQPGGIIVLTAESAEPIFATNASLVRQRLGDRQENRPSRFQQAEGIVSTAALPLIVRDETVGVLCINYRTVQEFLEPRRVFIEGLANYAAVAIRNSRAHDKLDQRRITELELLRTIDRAISKSLDLQEVLQSILEETCKHIPSDEAAILLYNSRSKILETQATFGRDAELRRNRVVPLDKERGITRWIFERKQPIRIGNVKTDPEWKDRYIEVNERVHSELGAPLLDDDEVVGVINFECDRIDAYSKANERFLSVLAGQVTIAIKNAQEYLALTQVSREIILQKNSQGIFELILSKAQEITKAPTGTLMVNLPGENRLSMAAGSGVHEEIGRASHDFSAGIVGLAARTGKTIRIDDIELPEWKTQYLDFIAGTRSELAVPLLDNDQVLGVINLESPIVGGFTVRNERMVNALANFAVIALQNRQFVDRISRSQDKLRSLHEIDTRIVAQLGSPDEVMKVIASSALRLTEAKIADLHLYVVQENDFGYIYSVMKEYNGTPESVRRIAPKDSRERKRGIIKYVAETRRTYRTVGDAVEDERYVAGKFLTHSELAVPLVENDVLIGVLNLESIKVDAFGPEDEEIVELLAGQAVIAILNARNFALAQSERQRFELLYSAGEELAGILDPSQLEDAYDTVVRIAKDHTNGQIALRRLHESSRDLQLVRVENADRHDRSSLPNKVIKIGEGWNGYVAQRRSETLLIGDVHHLPPGAPSSRLAHPAMHSYLVVPIQLRRGDLYYGNLSISHEQTDYFSEADQKLFEGLARELAITINRVVTIHQRQESEQRATEAEAMGTIGVSAYELMHRLGNDLGLVKTYINEIRMSLEDMLGEVPIAVDEQLNFIQTDVKKVLGLSHRLKTELSDEAEEDAVRIPVSTLLEEAELQLPPIPSHVRFEKQYDDAHALVTVRPSQIASVLTHLVENAFDAMPDGGELVIRVRSASHNVLIDVCDSGKGIAPEDTEKIFNLFFSKKKDGSGFGLWNARHKTLRNGGVLQVRSTPGRGSRFTLQLPIAYTDAEPQ